MVRLHSHPPRTGSAVSGGGFRGLAAGTLAAALMLFVPVVVWARVGGNGVPGIAAVMVVAVGACFGLLCWTIRHYVRRRLPPLQRIAPAKTQWSPASYRDHGRPRTTTTRPRRSGTPSHRCAPSRCRPAYDSRFPRDMGCRTSSRNLRGRTARRRTHP